MGDIVENIFTNMIKGKSIDNLGTMELSSIQYEVKIYRPMLNESKDNIFTYAHYYGIPYFKKSTPITSCRGVIRNELIPKLKDQFGNFEPNIIKMNEQCTIMYELNFKYVINPYLKTIQKFKYGIRIDYNLDLVLDIVWDRILLDYLHMSGYLMISVKSKQNLLIWLKSLNSNQYELSKTHFAYVEITHRYIYLINFFDVRRLTICNDLELLLNETKTNTLVEIPSKLKKLNKFI